MVPKRQRSRQKVDSFPTGPFNPNMLRMARLCDLSMTQETLAKEVGVPQSKISKWEDGILVPSKSECSRLAEALDFPDEFLFHPGQVYGFGSCCLYHRKRKSISVKLLNMLHARINVIGLGVERLLANASIENTVDFPRMDIDDYDSPEEIADLVRATWRVPPGPVENAMHYVEAAGALVIPMDYGTDKLDAVSLWPPQMPPLIFVNSQTPADRQRHTTIHEVGHLVMHAIPTPDREREADRFAAQFLMPAREIKAELKGMDLRKAARLKPKWRTAMSSLILRSRDTGAITERRAKTLFSELSRLGYRKNEPVRIERDLPKTLSKLISAHLGPLEYSEESIAKIALCRTVDQFDRRFRTGMRKEVALRVVHPE